MTATIYQLRVDKSSFELRVKRLSLPGVVCPTCGETWSATGIDYPLAGLAQGADPTPFEDAWPVPLDEYRRRAKLIVGVPPGCALWPGTEVGPLHGSVRGTIRDINTGFFNIVVKRSAFDALREEGVEVVGAPVLFRTPRHDLIELQIEPHGRLSSVCFPDRKYPDVCSDCGRISIVVPDVMVLERVTVPTGKDIFRAVDASTRIFVSERFRDACVRRELKGASFLAVPVA